MPREQYIFDEPIGLYGYRSHEFLARGVMRDLIQYEETFEATRNPLAELPYLGVATDRPDGFRLASLVESHDARLGYGLALSSPGQSDPVNMGGVFFVVDRNDGPSVKDDRPLSVARPETYGSNQDYRDQVESLMAGFDRRELETIMRMISKMTVSLDLASELRNADEDSLDEFIGPERRKRMAGIRRNREALARLSLIEPHVHFALRHHSKKQLNALFPAEQPFRSRTETTGEDEEALHIMEWREFMSAANGLIGEEADPDQAVSHVNVQHEVDSKLYYIKMAVEHGNIFGIQMLCDNTGAWQCQKFDLETADDGQAGRNIVNPFWDKDDILACLQDGEIIDDESYEYYRMLAEDEIKASFEKPGEIIHIQDIRKRLAA